jgi:WD40 repeat protein
MLLLEGHTSPVYALAFSPDGRHLASGTKDGSIWIWDESLARSEYATPGSTDNEQVNSLDWGPQADLLAASGGFGYVVGPPSVGGPTYSAQGTPATAARFLSPSLLVVGFGKRNKPEPGDLELWDVRRDKRREPSFDSPHGVRAVAVHPPTRRVAWSEWGGSQSGPRLTVWDITSPDQTRLNLSHNCPSLAFHPDGDRLAAASEWGVKVFDLTRKQERLALKGHKGTVSGIAYSPDGRALATGSWDGTVRLWDPETGTERACYQWPVGKVYALAYSPDGLRLAAAGEKGTIAMWDVD